MLTEDFEFLDIDSEKTEDEIIGIDKRAFKKLFYYTELGIGGINRLNTSEIGLLSKSGKSGVDIARLSYFNIINELKKIETLDLVKSSKIQDRNELNQSVDIKIFLRGLCRRITAVIGAAANFKIRFTSDIHNNTMVMCDTALLQFVIVNSLAVIASNISKEKRIINVHLSDEENRVCIKIWNKYAFRLNKKVIDQIDTLSMYSSDYEFEQMINISQSLISVMNGNAGTIIEDNIQKLSLSLVRCEDYESTEVYEFEDESVSVIQIVMPFAELLIKCINNSENYNTQILGILDEMFEGLVKE